MGLGAKVEVNKYIATNVLTVSDIPDTEEVLHGYEKISRNYLKKYMALKDFGKKLYFDTLYESIEFQYVFKKIDFDIKFNEKEKPFLALIPKQPFYHKYELVIASNNVDIIKTDTETEVREANTGIELIFTLIHLDNRIKETINYYTIKPKDGYLEKMKQIIISLNPNNRNELLQYLGNEIEWHIQNRSDIGTTYIAPPPPTKEELKIQEMDRMRNERNERDRQRKKEGLQNCYSMNCVGKDSRNGGFFTDSSLTNCRQDCQSIWR